jgi:RHS repeat-associated protein
VNELRSITIGPAVTDLKYDPAGNLKDDTVFHYRYDEEQRLKAVFTSVVDPLTGNRVAGTAIARYKYDALGRRILKRLLNADGSTQLVTRFYYDGDRVVEERTGGQNLPSRQYVWGNYVDELLISDSVDSMGNVVLGSRLYALQNSTYSVHALVNDAGTVVERYSYTPYGEATVLTPVGIPIPTSAVGNVYTFTGRELDAESGLYHFRARTYAPKLGRFIQRDPAGYVDGMDLYEYLRSSPTSKIDPFGLSEIPFADVQGLVGRYIDELADLEANIVKYRALLIEALDLGDRDAVLQHRAYWLAYIDRFNAQQAMLVALVEAEGFGGYTDTDVHPWIILLQEDDELAQRLAAYIDSLAQKPPPLTIREPQDADWKQIALGFAVEVGLDLIPGRQIYTAFKDPKSSIVGKGIAVFSELTGPLGKLLGRAKLLFKLRGRARVHEFEASFARAKTVQNQRIAAGHGTGVKKPEAPKRPQKPAGRQEPGRGEVPARPGLHDDLSTPEKVRNAGLAGKAHPKTKVPFDLNGFPIFDSFFDADLPADLLQATDTRQFNRCLSLLQQAIQGSPTLKRKFTESELNLISHGVTPKRFTWHHHQTRGKMQLVDSDIHHRTGHTGGRNIWGGGSAKR